MHRSVWPILGVIVLLAVIGGMFAIVRQSRNTAAPAPTTSSASSQPPQSSATVLTTKSSPSLGQYFATLDGSPLYTYTRDSTNVSNCTGTCLVNWPAFQDKGSTKNLPDDLSTIKRTDNDQIQFTYYGMPLYTFTGDKNGQVTGNNVAGFVLAKPAKEALASTSSALRHSTRTFHISAS